jgi:hypothetical protein
MKTVTEVLSEIKKTAKPFPKQRDANNLTIGKTVRQGDIYITRINSIPNDLKKLDIRQLAEGNSKGSRHIVSEGCIIYENPQKDLFQGHLIDATKEGFCLSHPEHGWINNFPKGCYSVSHQIDFNRQQRVKD